MSETPNSNADKPRTFEQALAELEAIVEAVEQGQIGLEESIAKYEQGMKLVKHCRAILNDAEKRIETIRTESTDQDSAAAGAGDQENA